MSQLGSLPRRIGLSNVPTLGDYRPTPTLMLEDRNFIRQLVDELLTCNLVLSDDWHALPEPQREWVLAALDQNDLIDRLLQHQLLTDYQAGRIKAGTVYGLVLGNYRILDRVGAGGMGIVFKAEHTLLRRVAALKVLPMARDQDSRMLRRFLAEMRTVASLQHPNIVAATDAGQVFPAEPNLPVLHYLVMEFVSGRDLEEIVVRDGPMEPDHACDLAHQVAGALAEAHNHNLVHRDIKPSNILVNSLNQAKLLDFGLARDFANQMTDPGSLLGTIDYMAPEQAQDPTSVDIRADIYGLGATLFWCLTGKVPFPASSSLSQQIAQRLREVPPSVRARRPDVSPELDAVIVKMMATRAEDRFQTPQAVMRALTPFLRGDRLLPGASVGEAVTDAVWALADAESADQPRRRILVVDDDPNIGEYCKAVLANETTEIDVVSTGAAALEAANASPFDLVLLDLVLPDIPGLDVLPQIRERPACRNTSIILISGYTAPDDLAQMLNNGANDFIAKPFGSFQLRSRVQHALRLNDALRRIETLSHHAKAVSHDLERTIEARLNEMKQSRQALIQGLASVYVHRIARSDHSLLRMQHYTRALAEEAAADPALAADLTASFIQTLEQSVPLYDIGLIALPDQVVHKAGMLDPEERIVMQSHTTLGHELLQRIASSMGKPGEFLNTAMQMARHHHEQFNGRGYPDRLAGEAIPLAARIVTLIDAYEALRTRRSAQPTLPHEAACEVILEASPGRFDPRLLDAFRRCADKFNSIHQQIAD